MIAMAKPSNKGVELPAGSVRSSLAPAIGSSSRVACGVARLNFLPSGLPLSCVDCKKDRADGRNGGVFMSETDASSPDMALDQIGKGVYLATYNRLTPILEEVLSGDAGPPNSWERDYKLALLYFFSKALKTYQAICCLWTTGFEQDASVLSRTLFEIVLQCE